MRFNQHWSVEGKHAFLGASKHHWLGYDMEKLKRTWTNQFASQRGTELHIWAAMTIKLKIRMKRDSTSLNCYVNDAIGFMMTPEVVLHYDDDCFGTADCISFHKGVLRIHDLKTGVHPGHFNQLCIYAALFCLEYNVNPYDIEMYFRIYQGDVPYVEMTGDPKFIKEIMDKFVEYAPVIKEMKEVLL